MICVPESAETECKDPALVPPAGDGYGVGTHLAAGRRGGRSAFRILILGDSTKPMYRKGHRVIVSPVQAPYDGEEARAHLPDGRRVAKLAFRRPHGGQLERVNSAYEPIDVADDEVVAIYPIVWAKRNAAKHANH